MELKRTITIDYTWYNEEVNEITSDCERQLEEAAIERIIEMMKETYIAGELHYDYYDPSTEEETHFTGWFDVKVKEE